MSRIRILSDRVANQIAAGEVIERPAAVVKELVENSMDAGATRVEIEFRNGGRSLIRIEDDGSGMSQDEALLSLERHATSKISEAADLQRILTFGFRGEALPSIASVSRFTMQTRPADSEHGSEILVNGGRMVHVRECGMPQGTRIEVANLFQPVPVRRKFLKTDATESAHIVQAARLHAIANPKVAFRVIENGRTVFQSPSCPSLEDRLREVFGRRVAADLLKIESEEGGVRLAGFIGKPTAGRATRHEMITFVNNRPVDSRTLGYALLESYHESMPKGRYPVAFLYLEMDPAGVDVNVHPSKREVRFRNEGEIRRFVIDAVRARLREERAASFAAGAPAQAEERQSGEGVTVSSIAKAAPAPKVVPPPNVSPAPQPTHEGGGGNGPGGGGGAPSSGGKEETIKGRQPVQPWVDGEGEAARGKKDERAFSWRYVGEACDGLALFETNAGLVVLDCRAAQERLLFEEIISQFAEGPPPRQALLFPVSLELDPVAAALLEEHLVFLQKHGFEIAPFGRNFFRIEGVPIWLEPGRSEEFVRDVVALMRERGLSRERADLAREEVARLAARRCCTRPGGGWDEKAAVALAHRLLASANPLTSPQGRATFFELSRGEIESRLKK